MVLLTPEQHKIRSMGVGSSDIAAIAGLSPWAQPIDIYRRKLGLAPPAKGAYLTAGHVLEDPVAKWASRRRGWTLRRCKRTLVHQREPWIVATPDRFICERKVGSARGARIALAEIKTAGTREGWGTEGTDQIPDYYRTQCQWQLTVIRSRQPHIELVYVPVFFFTSRQLAIYKVTHSGVLEEALVEVGYEFWHDRVLAEDPPLDDPSQPGVHRYLAEVLGQTSNRVVPAPLEAQRWASQLYAARKMIAEAEGRAAEAEAYLKAYVGEDKGLEGPWGRYLWSMRSGSTDWKGLAEAMFDKFGVTEDGRAELVGAHQRDGFRSPRFTPNKDYFEGAE